MALASLSVPLITQDADCLLEAKAVSSRTRSNACSSAEGATWWVFRISSPWRCSGLCWKLWAICYLFGISMCALDATLCFVHEGSHGLRWAIGDAVAVVMAIVLALGTPPRFCRPTRVDGNSTNYACFGYHWLDWYFVMFQAVVFIVTVCTFAVDGCSSAHHMQGSYTACMFTVETKAPGLTIAVIHGIYWTIGMWQPHTAVLCSLAKVCLEHSTELRHVLQNEKEYGHGLLPSLKRMWDTSQKLSDWKIALCTGELTLYIVFDLATTTVQWSNVLFAVLVAVQLSVPLFVIGHCNGLVNKFKKHVLIQVLDSEKDCVNPHTYRHACALQLGADGTPSSLQSFVSIANACAT